MPFIIFFRGNPGVGKSTIARQLGKSLGLAVIDYDDIKGCLVDNLDNPTLSKVSYEIAKNIIESNIKSDLSIIFDSHGYYREAFEKCISIAGKKNVIVINCECSNDNKWQANLLSRKNSLQSSQINDFELIKEASKKKGSPQTFISD